MAAKSGNKLLWIVVNTCRLLVSATFIFSGMVKLLDPVGLGYKIEDYLIALDLQQLTGTVWTLLLGVGLALVEFLLGVYLFFGIRRRLATWGILLFLIFYTPLTLWLAATDGVADCGCFGDAVKLTNWQTFWKNLVLLVAAVIVWWQGRRLTRFISESVAWVISLYSILFGFAVGLYCCVEEPFLDFRPYHVGQHIPTAMQWPDDPEALPEILDFDVAPEVLEDTSFTFLLISPHLELADDGTMDVINSTYDFAHSRGYRFLALTASSDEAIRRWQDLTGAEYAFDFMDDLTLKTIARTNPALLLLHDGTIVGKWAAVSIPVEDFATRPMPQVVDLQPKVLGRFEQFLYLLILYAMPLFALTLVDRIVCSIKWWIRRRRTIKNK